MDDWSVREDHEVPELSQPENHSVDCEQDEIGSEGGGSGMDGGESEEDLIPKDVEGSFGRLCAELEGTGKKAVVSATQANEGVHSIILVIEPDKHSFPLDQENPSWVGLGSDLHTAKDVAAYKGLKHFSWLSD